MCSDRKVIALTGSMPSDAHCAAVGTKRATRLAWLDTSVSLAAEEILEGRPSCVITTIATAATAITATTIITCVWRSPARAHRDKNMLKPQTSSLEEAILSRV